jgi:glucose/arabinose dehydrogenase
MKRQLMLAGGCLLLIGGWMSAFMIRAIPQQSDLFYLVPALALGCGMGLLLKLLNTMRTAIVVALMAIISIVSVNQIYPIGKISVSGFFQSIEKQATGKPLEIEVQEKDRTGLFARERIVYATADLRISLFSRLPGAARMLAFDDKERLYVSIPKLGAIYQLIDENGDGFAEQPVLFHVGMDRPHGLVWQDDKLFVAETSRLLELKDKDQDNQVDETRTILENLPDDGGHWTRSLAMGADGYLYLSIGSRCNACEEPDQRRATVLRVDPEKGTSRIFAKGLRNAVGLTFSADGETLWGSDNGRDMLGDYLPPDEINRLVADGDYGWPYCFGDRMGDPELGSRSRCAETLPAAVELPAHSAPLGITFGDRLDAPAEYRNSLYVAFHGSWNRSVPTGYKLIRIPFDAGRPSKAGKEFLSGWLLNDSAWGRPVAPVVGPDGNLYLSDDRANAIYRISWIQQG